MRIAYCLHSLHRSGGIERVISLKASYLADHAGHEVHIITACLKGRRPAFPLSSGIMVHDLGANDNIPLSGFVPRLGRILEEIRPDICIAIGDNCLKGLLDCGYNGKKIAEFHFSYEKYMMKYGSNAAGRMYARYRTARLAELASKADRFVVLTEADKADWCRVAGNVTRIYNPKTFSSQETAPLEERRCIAVGRLEKQKNFSDAVKAWKTVAERYPDWTLDIYGAGSLESDLRKQISQLSLDGKVRLMGLSHDIRKEMMESSILLMSSAFEGFPMVLLEAAETGLPAVSYDCPKGPAEIIDDGHSGFLARPGDTQGLAEALCTLIGDDARRAACGRAAREKAAAFSMERIMAEWDRLFEDLLKS